MLEPSEEFRPTLYLFLLACGVLLSIGLGIYVLILGEEVFASGVAFFGAAVMIAGALFGFGPRRRNQR